MSEVLISGRIAESGTCKLTDGNNDTCVTMETDTCSNFIDVSHIYFPWGSGSIITVAANNQIKTFGLDDMLTCDGCDGLLINRCILGLISLKLSTM